MGNVGNFLSDYRENLNNMLCQNGVLTGGAAGVVSNTAVPLEGYISNDDSNIFQKFLKMDLPQNNEFSPTIDNLNKYENNPYFQTFPAHNDEALIDEWAIPNLVTCGMGLYNAGKTAFEFAPYVKDTWAGRNLLFHKPFKWMNKQEYDNYGQIGKNYFQNYLQKNPIKKEGYGDINFGSDYNGKDFFWKMEQYPFLRKQLYNAKKFNTTNDKNAINMVFDHLHNNFKNKLYDYIIENNNDKGLYYKMIKEIKKRT